MERDKVWVRDARECWRLMDVVSSSGARLVVEDDDERQRDVDFGDTRAWDASHEDAALEDVYQMGDMNEAGLLWLLRERARGNKVYTHIGDILLSVNPYREAGSEDFLRAVADRAFEDMLHNGPKGRSQSVLINGESGAGKTEASKRVMGFLAKASAKRRKGKLAPGPSMRGAFTVAGLFGKRGAKAGKPQAGKPQAGKPQTGKPQTGAPPGQASQQPQPTQLETNILETNPVLESFGNARTVSNDNSSRFGKFVRLEYSKDGVIVGARTLHFLLEKSRVVSHAQGERNYHIFYELCAGAAAGLVPDDLPLDSWAEYRYLTPQAPAPGAPASAKDASAAGDLERFRRLQRALASLGFLDAELRHVWETLTGVLLLGNLSFRDATTAGRRTVDCEGIHPALPGLLGVREDDLRNALCKRSVRAGRRVSVSIVPLSRAEAESSRDALAKALFAALFDWLVRRVNGATNLTLGGAETPGVGAARGAPNFIGILDIFGFEILARNSFEQLCINTANEKLQGLFDDRVFSQERSFLASQGVSPPHLSFRDNAGLLALLDSKPSGIFQLLDEQGALGARGSDGGFLQALQATHRAGAADAAPGSDRLLPAKFARAFVVDHFAGPVQYDVEGLVAKNADHLQPDLRDLIVDSREPNSEFPRQLLAPRVEARARKERVVKVTARSAAAAAAAALDESAANGPPATARKMAKLESVSLRFRTQMSDLNDLLHATDLHFVRCIKPNDTKLPPAYDWNAPRVLTQLRMLGVLEMVAVRKQGFPVRADFATLLQRYPELLAAHNIVARAAAAPPSQRPVSQRPVSQRPRSQRPPSRRPPSQQPPPSSEPAEPAVPAGPQAVRGDDRSMLAAMLAAVLGPDSKGPMWQLGTTKCFMVDEAAKKIDHDARVLREQAASAQRRLEQRRAAREAAKRRYDAATRIAARFRAHRERAHLADSRAAALALQSFARRQAAQRQRAAMAEAKRAELARQREERALAMQRRAEMGQWAVRRLQAMARGARVRGAWALLQALREPFKLLLRPNEAVLHVTTVSRAKRGRLLTKGRAYQLVFTSGPSPRLLLVIASKKLLREEIPWQGSTTAFMANSEHSLAVHAHLAAETTPDLTRNRSRSFIVAPQRRRKAPKAKQADAAPPARTPAGDEAPNTWKFAVHRSHRSDSVVAAGNDVTNPEVFAWLLMGQGVHSVHSLLRVCAAAAGGSPVVAGLMAERQWGFGGEGALGGLDEVDLRGSFEWSQRRGTAMTAADWRRRHFVLKGTALYWFKAETEGALPLGGFSINELCSVRALKRAEATSRRPHMLEIASPLMETPVRLSLPSERVKKQWVAHIKAAIKRRVQGFKRHTLTRGFQNAKAWEPIQEALAAARDEEDAEEDAEVDGESSADGKRSSAGSAAVAKEDIDIV